MKNWPSLKLFSQPFSVTRQQIISHCEILRKGIGKNMLIVFFFIFLIHPWGFVLLDSVKKHDILETLNQK